MKKIKKGDVVTMIDNPYENFKPCLLFDDMTRRQFKVLNTYTLDRVKMVEVIMIAHLPARLFVIDEGDINP